MALQRRLVFGLLMVISLLCVYILYEKLEKTSQLLRHFYGITLGTKGVSEEPPDPQSNSDQWSPPHPVYTYNPQLSSGTDQHERTRAAQSLTSKTQMSAAAKEQNPANHKVDINPEGMSEASTSAKGQRATQPTDPPFIGDSYKSEGIRPQTDCTDSIRSHLAHTEFGHRFLRNITVLQWVQHVTLKQHERLSKYPGAHGYGSIDYKTLKETLSVLNSTANWQLLDDWSHRGSKSACIRCAVVGNGGILKGSKKGKEIDRHHYVFRTNGAIITGFEEDVGSRTTHYTFSANTLKNSMRAYAQFGFHGPPLSNETRYIFLPDHNRDYLLLKAVATHTPVEGGLELGKDWPNYFGADVSKEKLKMYHPDFIRYLRNRFLRSNVLKTKYKDIYRPSTGAVMLLAALHTCDQVSAYGFMTPDYKSYSDHYYDRSYHPVGFFVNHDLRMEMTLWQKLHQARLVRLYMHQ